MYLCGVVVWWCIVIWGVEVVFVIVFFGGDLGFGIYL